MPVQGISRFGRTLGVVSDAGVIGSYQPRLVSRSLDNLSISLAQAWWDFRPR